MVNHNLFCDATEENFTISRVVEIYYLMGKWQSWWVNHPIPTNFWLWKHPKQVSYAPLGWSALHNSKVIIPSIASMQHDTWKNPSNPWTYLFFQSASEIHHRHIWNGHTECHASKLAVKFWDDLTNSFGSSSWSRDNILMSSTSIAPFLHIQKRHIKLKAMTRL